MRYLGDYAAGATVDFDFNTRDKANNAPITLAGTPAVSVYKANSTTETTIGVTLTVDFDGRTGTHHVRVVLSDAFYAVQNDFSVVITTGTVDGVSVVGTVIGTFSIENRAADVRRWIGSAVVAANSAGVPRVDVDMIEGANVNTSAAQLGVNVVSGGASFPTLRTGTAQACDTATVTLDASASATDNFYRYAKVAVSGSTGATEKQIRHIKSYVGSTKVATFDVPLLATPTGTITFTIFQDASTFMSDGTVVYDAATDSLAGSRNNSPTLQEISDEILNETLAENVTADSVGVALKSIRDHVFFKLVCTSGTIDASPSSAHSATAVELDNGAPAVSLVGLMIYFYHDSATFFQARKIDTYDTTNKRVGFNAGQALPSAPPSGTKYVVLGFEDSYSRIGAPPSPNLSSAVSAANSGVADLQGRIPTALAGDGSIKANLYATQSNSITSDSLDVSAVNEVADKILARSIAGGSDGGRTVSSALATIRNRVVRSGNLITVYDIDDTTALYTATITSSAENPITSFDPA